VIQRLAATSNRDSHLLFAQLGDKLGLLPETTVAAAFTNIWAQAYPAKVSSVLEPIRDRLPAESTNTIAA
jgi:hypothetical protein